LIFDVSQERSIFAYRSEKTYKIQARRSFETSETDYQVTELHIPEEWNPQTHRCENPHNSHKIILPVVSYECKTWSLVPWGEGGIYVDKTKEELREL